MGGYDISDITHCLLSLFMDLNQKLKCKIYKFALNKYFVLKEYLDDDAVFTVT